MIKQTCDCCGIRTKNWHTIHYSPHVDQILDGDDENMYRIKSWECIDLCLRCYNNIMVSCIRKFRELKRGFIEISK